MSFERPSDNALLESFRERGQEHVFRFLPELDPEEAEALISQARSIDLDLLSELCGQSADDAGGVPTLEPFPASRADSAEGDAARTTGRDLLATGKVGLYTVAGGQGTRLGYDGPKGCYRIPTAGHRPLFAWHAEKVLAAGKRYGVSLPWVILVSDVNAAATRKHFEENGWYGQEKQIRFVRQKMLPAVDSDGRILLSGKGSIALSPNGHGGSIDALADHGALDWLTELGVEVVSYFQVDNALLNPADPVFVGFHVNTQSEMGVKVVLKNDPLEKAGVVAYLNGEPGIIEYSELPEDLARMVTPDGELLYGLANIAAHTLSVPFLRRMAGTGLPYHVAKKKIKTIDDAGHPVKVDGRKFETFIFDAIPRANGFFACLVRRSEEFAPLKNAEGDNSPASVVAALSDRTRSWFERADAPLAAADEVPEITPLTAYDFESFTEALPEIRKGLDA